MDDLILMRGNHQTRQQGQCVMEAVAWFAGEPHSDAPACACPVISAFARRLNDRLDDAHRQELKPLIPAMALSRSTREIEVKRAYLAADFAVRRAAPHALDRRGFREYAARLRALDPVVDMKTAGAARKTADAAADAAYAAAAAADAANATDAADAAAYAADAAAHAAYAAAYAAAAAADSYAAAHAAYAAAYAAKKKTAQDWLLGEGLTLLNAMLAVR